MKSYKLIVAYDGSGYCGWQEQIDQRSIAQVLSNSFKSVFNVPIKIWGASRTDAGVHALGQVVLVRTDIKVDLNTLRWAWNNALPLAVFIRSLELAADSFNPFCNVQQKTYYYHFFTQRPLPFAQHYGYYYPYPITIDLLKQALHFFVGTHDFASFRSSEDVRSETIRTIDEISLQYIKRYNVYRIVVKGQKFLRHMIRRIVGASFAVASRSGYSLKNLEEVMKRCNPGHTLPNAPAKGLMLYKIVYETIEEKETS